MMPEGFRWSTWRSSGATHACDGNSKELATGIRHSGTLRLGNPNCLGAVAGRPATVEVGLLGVTNHVIACGGPEGQTSRPDRRNVSRGQTRTGATGSGHVKPTVRTSGRPHAGSGDRLRTPPPAPDWSSRPRPGPRPR